MKRRKFEEILDECISAYLSRRRSVEDSLSLYPSIARELEPLLRAAADTADAIQELHPPPHVQERIRQRILRAANERAAARSLTRGIDGFTEAPRRRSYWLVAFPAIAAATAAIVVSGMFFLGESSGPPAQPPAAVSVAARPEFTADLNHARRQLDTLRNKAARGQEVTSADLDALRGATLRLGANALPEELPAIEQAEVEEIIEQQLVLLSQLDDTADSEGIEDAVAATVSVAAAFGVALPESTSGAASPAATSSPGAGTRTPSPASSVPSPSPTASAGSPSSN